MRVMRALVTRTGGLNALKVEQWPDPAPGPGEVSIEVRAAGLNFADVMARKGLYPDAPKPPAVMGYEVAGVVSELGEGVDGFAVGDRVLGGTHFGGQAELAVTNVGNVIAIPDRFSFEQAAVVPVNYVTAWAALVRYGNVQPGERVLVHAAAGGVGIAALQIARRQGAEIYGTASPGKHAAVLEHGADVAVDYTRSGWQNDLPKFDLVLDAIGGRMLRTSYRLLRPGGRVITYGATALASGRRRNLVRTAFEFARTPIFHPVRLGMKSTGVIGLNMLRLWDELGTLAPYISRLGELFDDGTIKPVIAASLPFERAAEAHEMLLTRANTGKVVLTPS